MTIKIKKMIPAFLSVLLVFTAVPGFAGHGLMTEPQFEESLVEPGAALTCGNNFHVGNLRNEEAAIQLILGGSKWAEEKLKSNQTKSYNLQELLAKAKLSGKPVRMDDAAVIMNITHKYQKRPHSIWVNCEKKLR